MVNHNTRGSRHPGYARFGLLLSELAAAVGRKFVFRDGANPTLPEGRIRLITCRGSEEGVN